MVERVDPQRTTSVDDSGSQIKEVAQETVQQVRDRAAEYYEQGRRKAGEWQRDLKGSIQEKPFQSMLIAGGISLLLGALLAPSRREDFRRNEGWGTYIRRGAREQGRQARGRAAEYYGQGRARAGKYYEQGLRKASEWERGLEEGIRDNPVQSVLIAGGVGLLLGALFMRK